jgi:hypothetical protein
MPLRVIESKERLFEAILERASLAVLFGDLVMVSVLRTRCEHFVVDDLVIGFYSPIAIINVTSPYPYRQAIIH